MSDAVYIVDDNVKARGSIAFTLNNNGFVAEPFEAVDEFINCKPTMGVILVGYSSGYPEILVREIFRNHCWLPVVAYSENPTPDQIVDAVLSGVVGYVEWPGCGDTLIRVLRNAVTRYDKAIASGSRQRLAQSKIELLSKRERQILAGMVEGWGNRQIGEHLAISRRTVELHRANMIEKMGAKHSAEVIRLAVEASMPAFDPGSIFTLAK